MFENPIIFALIVSSISSICFYLFNREKDKRSKDFNPNMKYIIVFGIVFILGLIGKILYSGCNTVDIETEINEATTDIVKDISIDGGGEVDVSAQPPF